MFSRNNLTAEDKHASLLPFQPPCLFEESSFADVRLIRKEKAIERERWKGSHKCRPEGAKIMGKYNL